MADDQDLPFETLLKLQETLGTKTFREARDNNKSDEKSRKRKTKSEVPEDEAPEEYSSKHPFKKQLLKPPPRPQQQTQRSIDPRFNSRSGNFKEDHFRRHYQFAFDLREQELTKLKSTLPKAENSEEKEKSKYLIQRMENQKREQQKRHQQRNQSKAIINKDGSKYFPSKKEQRAQELVAKFRELKESGQLEKHLEKRRKKQAGKERKKMNIEK